MFDFHTHTNNSLDSNRTIGELCECAMEQGLLGVAVTDHAETWYYNEHQPVKHIKQCIQDVKKAREKYNIKVFQGIELGSPFFDKQKADELMSLCQYDVVLNSVHCVSFGGISESFAAIKFTDVPDDIIYGLVDVYFEELEYTAKHGDFDIMCHITYPFRYINGRYKKNIDVMKYEKHIENIFEVLINRGKSLEINTSSMGERYGAYNGPCPDEYFIKKYFNMGGRLITPGSDSHRNSDGFKPGNGFDVLVPMLKNIGFDKFAYFEKRKIFFENI